MTTATLNEPTSPPALPAEPGWHIAADAIRLRPIEPNVPAAAMYGSGKVLLLFTPGGGVSVGRAAMRNTSACQAMDARDRAAVRARLEQSSDLLRLRHAAAEVAEREGPARLTAAQAAEAKAHAERVAIDPDASTADRAAAHKTAERAAREASTAAAKLAASQEHLTASRAAVAREAEHTAIEVFTAAERDRKAEVKALLAEIAARVAPQLERLAIIGHELSGGSRESVAIQFAQTWLAEQLQTTP